MTLFQRLVLVVGVTVALALSAVWLMVADLGTARYQAQSEQRLAFRMQAARADIENRISLGVDLPRSLVVQDLIEDLHRQDPDSLAVDVISPQGVTLFSTDRALIGDQAPPVWQAVRKQSAGSPEGGLLWRGQGPDGTVSGVALRNDLHEEVGVLVATTRRANGDGYALLADLSSLLAGGLVAAGALAVGIGFVLSRTPERQATEFVAGLTALPVSAGGPVSADRRFGQALQDRLGWVGDRLDQVSQRLSGADDETR